MVGVKVEVGVIVDVAVGVLVKVGVAEGPPGVIVPVGVVVGPGVTVLVAGVQAANTRQSVIGTVISLSLYLFKNIIRLTFFFLRMNILLRMSYFNCNIHFIKE